MQKVKVGDIFVTKSHEEWLVVRVFISENLGAYKLDAVSKITGDIGHTTKLQWSVVREADEETLRWVEEVLSNG